MFDGEKYKKLIQKLKNPTEFEIRRAIRNAKGIAGVTRNISVDGSRAVEVLDKCGKVVDMVTIPK